MSNAASTYRRRLGRAPSPPTWLWYEQIPYDDDSSCSDDDASADGGDYDDDDDDHSCSEDDEDYARVHGSSRGAPAAPASESGSNTDSNSGADEAQVHMAQQDRMRASDGGAPKEGMEVDDAQAEGDCSVADGGDGAKKDVKGKQRAIEPEVIESPKRRERRKRREPVMSLRPILTIQKSQGFVWNQDLFVPPYIKDRYVASTSPPNANGRFTSATSSYNSMNDYEVDVVEIRVKEGEYADIIP